MENSENIVKCGEKGRHLRIPDGYKLLGRDIIITEEMRDHVLVANIRDLHWEQLYDDDIGFKADLIGDHVIIEMTDEEKMTTGRIDVFSKKSFHNKKFPKLYVERDFQLDEELYMKGAEFPVYDHNYDIVIAQINREVLTTKNPKDETNK